MASAKARLDGREDGDLLKKRLGPAPIAAGMFVDA